MSQVMSGQLVAPSVPTAAETMEMQRLVDTYGKTFHTWQVLDQAYETRFWLVGCVLHGRTMHEKFSLTRLNGPLQCNAYTAPKRFFL